jgi:hypothetical protein
MQEHSCCSVDIELMQLLVCPNCGYSVSFSLENPSANFPACFDCQTAMNVLRPEAIGTYPFELEGNYNAKDRVSGTLAEKYDQLVLLSEIYGYLNALKCLPCIGRITVLLEQRAVQIEGWMEVFTLEAKTLAHHAVSDSLVFAATNIAAHLPETASYEITYTQSFQEPEEYRVL